MKRTRPTYVHIAPLGWLFEEAHCQVYMTYDILKVMISKVKITDNFSSGGMLIDRSAGVDDHLVSISLLLIILRYRTVGCDDNPAV